jgi:DNA processing protein
LLPQSTPPTASQLDDDRLAWLTLTLAPGLGPKRILDAVKLLDAPSQIFRISLTELESLRFPAEAAQFIFDGKGRQAAETEWAQVMEYGGTIFTYGCAAYPERLKEIYDPPPVLWVRGDLGLLARPAIAIVGTRHPSPYGSGVAEMLARDLAARRLLILSGMARGIDTCAHKGALTARMPTVAVWGTGIDVVYPKENRKLSEEILATGGTIVSELPMGTFPAPQNFPRRNRILSGLSLAVLVVEASENSGTRVTARCAAEQNRDLYAVPGNVTNKNSWTPNTLIKHGASSSRHGKMYGKTCLRRCGGSWKTKPKSNPVMNPNRMPPHLSCRTPYCGVKSRSSSKFFARMSLSKSTKSWKAWRAS